MHEQLHEITPLWRSDPLSAALGQEVWMKMDCWQPTGSFKLRGMGRACTDAVEGGATRIVSSSGGNAGNAISHACRELGVRATIVVPETTSEFMRARIRELGAEVLEHGDSWDDAHAHALSLCEPPTSVYVHPFDDPRAWDGHASLIEEAARQGPEPAIVVASVGGGGLLCGILEGLHRVGWQHVPVLAVETEGAASFHDSVLAGKLVTLDAIRSIATTLGARTVASRALEWTDRHEIVPVLVSDAEAVAACRRFADDHRVLVEPACGASLATIYGRHPWLSTRGPVLIEICGGAGVRLDQLESWC